MKRFLPIIIAIFACGGLSAQAPIGIITKVETPPVIDGELDQVWDAANVYNIDKPFQAEIPTLGESGETTWRMLWDEDGLYVFLVVNDDHWYPDYISGRYQWESDKPELHFDMNYILADGLGARNGQGHYQVAPAAAGATIDGTAITQPNGVVYAFLVNNPDYTVEYFIPWDLLRDQDGFAFDKSGVMGFDVTIIDRDPGDTGRRRAVWANVGTIDDSWRNMDDAGYIFFDGVEPPVYIDKITLIGGTINVDNGTLQIQAIIEPEGATNKNLTWSVENKTGRAKISQTGLLTAILDGVVTVIADATDGSYEQGRIDVSISGQIPAFSKLNVIRNGSFDEVAIDGSPVDWGGWIDGGFGPEHAVVDGVATLIVTNEHPAEAWHYQFGQDNLTALPDIPYVISYDAWADKDREITFQFEDTVYNDYNLYGASPDSESNGRSTWTHSITTEPETFSWNVNFDQITPTTIQKAVFHVAQAAGTVYIDNVLLISQADIALVLNSNFLVLNVKMAYWAQQGNFNPASDFVDVAGTFNAWDGRNHRLTPLNDNDLTYSISIPNLEIGNDYSFRFRINGSWSDETVEFPGGGPDRTCLMTTGYSIYTAWYNDDIPAATINPPSIITASISNISKTSARGGGNVTSDGGATVTERGIVYGTSQNPTTSNNKVTAGSGTGSFTANMTGLQPGTTYYVRAYAINSAGTAYGNQVSFNTDPAGSPPVANFTGTPTSGTAPLTVQFTDQSTNNPTSWSWDFGDGSTSALRNPSKTYNTAGTYTVAHTSSNSFGSNTHTKNSYITVTHAVGGDWPRDTETQVVDVTNPVTGKTWMDRNLGANRAATSSTDAQAYGDLYQWGRAADGHQKRNSGLTSTLSNNDTPGHGNFIQAPNFPYDWRSPQNNNLWQGVNGVNNPCPTGYRLPTEAELNAERLSWSSNNSAGAFASPLKLPVAGYRSYYYGSIGSVGSGGHFWSSTVDGANSRGLYFGSTGANMNGSTRARGLSVRCLKEFAAGSVPGSNFIGTPTSGAAPLTVQFTDQSTNNPTSWSWDFGDGSASAQRNPSKTYNTAGTYTVRLTATNSYGSNTYTRNNYIVIGNPPVAAFSGTPTSGTAPLTVQFTDQSTNNPTSWSWDFGDGSTSAQRNPSKTYNTTGTYTVRLTVTNSYGSNTQTRNNYITVSAPSGPETGTLTDPRDGQTYKWVKIGDQVWMAENLKYMPFVAYSQVNSETSPLYYVYGYQSSNVNDAKSQPNFRNYGVLYNWSAVMAGFPSSSVNPSGVQGVCPSGWHVPSDAEWTQMVDYLMNNYSYHNESDDAYSVGNALKSCRQVGSPLGGECNISYHPRWNSDEDEIHYGTDIFGFSALPGGRRHNEGDFKNLGGEGNWWSSTEISSTNAWSRNIYNRYGHIQLSSNIKSNGFSVRCIQDVDPQVNIPSVTTGSISNISQTSAHGGGNVTSDGGATVTERGIVYSTSQNPTTSNNKVTSGSGTGSFIANMTGLSPSTTYYVRAYATNSAGTGYGSQRTFTTQAADQHAVISSPTVDQITNKSARVCYTVTSLGNPPVTNHGISYGTSTNPEQSISQISSGNTTGTICNTISGLSPNTTYYLRTFTTNATATLYQENISFKTTSTEGTPRRTVYIDLGISQPNVEECFLENYSVTFNVNMKYVDGYFHPFTFNPNYHKVYITGSMFEWFTPGTYPELQTLVPSVIDPVWYSKTLILEPGSYRYRYFINEGWAYGEWDGGSDREVTVADKNMEIYDWFGFLSEPTLVPEIDGQKLLIYPNPAKHQLNVEISGREQMLQIRIVDLLGQEVINLKNPDQQQVQIDIRHLKAGMFLVQVYTANNIYISKFQISQ